MQKITPKVIFKNKRDPIQIFCPQKFKGYSIRGQVTEFSDNIYAEDEDYYYAYYHCVILALVNNEYHRNLYKEERYFDDFAIFECSTANEFIQIRKDYHINLSKHSSTGEHFKKFLDDFVNPPINIGIKDLPIQETPYLLNAIRSKKEVILLKLQLYLDRVESTKYHAPIADYPERIYILPAYHLAELSHFEEHETQEWFYDLHEILYYHFNFDFEDNRNKMSNLVQIGNIAWQWINKGYVSNKSLRILNNLYGRLKAKDNPYKEFCFSFLNELIDDLTKEEIFGQCSHCGDFFGFVESKKYCSLRSEGKDCGKSARNKRYYAGRGKIRLPIYRQTTQELRDFYKEKGVKK